MKTYKNKKGSEIPDSAVNQADDKPAARGILITIILLISILGVIYFIFFKDYFMSLFPAD
ncbi:hypothetical protein [Sphingobacterium sp. MYb382]|uniref:hypothetical protein n=1 Tax=Sphingobacterium sp. MYb382 TaxID=2745278 RepID=UPI0030AA5317